MVFSYFCRQACHARGLRATTNDNTRMEGNILFLNTFDDIMRWHHAGRVLHILCTAGSMSFACQNVRYNIAASDYVILPNAMLATDFSGSADLGAIIMSLSERFVTSMAIRSNYGITGHLSLLQNPVMKLSAHDFHVCREGMLLLRERLEDKDHLFYEEMTGSLLSAHVLDLYDIHARNNVERKVPERAASLLRQFIGMLLNGDYATHRDLDYYASRLCVTPHYLSEVCRKACGRPASYWIDRFTLSEITRMLTSKDMSLADITARLNFSSQSYFCRYVQKRLGVSPSEYRKNS